MSTYYGIRCKCVVKKEYRKLVGELLNGENFLECSKVTNDARLSKIQNIHRIEYLFTIPPFDDAKDFDEDVVFQHKYNMSTGEWHFCKHINHAEQVFRAFVRIIIPTIMEKIIFLQMQMEDAWDEEGIVYTTNREQVRKDSVRYKLFSDFLYEITEEGIDKELEEM